MGPSKKFQHKNKQFNRNQGAYQTVKPEKILSLKKEYSGKPEQPVQESNRLSDVIKKPFTDAPVVDKPIVTKKPFTDVPVVINKPIVVDKPITDAPIVINKPVVDSDLVADNKALDYLIKEQKSIMNDFDRMEQNIHQNNDKQYQSSYPDVTTLNLEPKKELDVVKYTPNKPGKVEKEQKELYVMPYKPNKKDNEFGMIEPLRLVEPNPNVKENSNVKKNIKKN